MLEKWLIDVLGEHVTGALGVFLLIVLWFLFLSNLLKRDRQK